MELVDEELITVINKNAATMQRKCRRLVEQHGLKERMSGEEGRGAAAGMYGRPWRSCEKKGRWSWGRCDEGRRARCSERQTTGDEVRFETNSGC